MSHEKQTQAEAAREQAIEDLFLTAEMLYMDPDNRASIVAGEGYALRPNEEGDEELAKVDDADVLYLDNPEKREAYRIATSGITMSIQPLPYKDGQKNMRKTPNGVVIIGEPTNRVYDWITMVDNKGPNMTANSMTITHHVRAIAEANVRPGQDAPETKRQMKRQQRAAMSSPMQKLLHRVTGKNSIFNLPTWRR